MCFAGCKNNINNVKSNMRNNISSQNSGEVNSDLIAFENKYWKDPNKILPTFNTPAETLDYIDVSQMNYATKLAIASLKAIVNTKQPRIYTNDGTDDNNNWLDDFGIQYKTYTDPFELFIKYKDELTSVVIYDEKINHTVNLACTIAGIKKSIVVSQDTMYKLQEKGINLKIEEDLRNRFNTQYEVYNYLYTNYWNQVTKKAITSQNPIIANGIREYGMAIRSAFIWFDVKTSEDSKLLEKFLADMKPGYSAYLGWFPEGNEGLMVALTSKYGLVTYASDFAHNLIFLSGMNKEIIKPKEQPVKKLGNKVYVALIVSDGDNIGTMMQARMKQLWKHPKHGTFPVSWSVNPTSSDIMPGILNWYYRNANDNVGFLTGPSGLTYNYPRSWDNKEAKQHIMDLTNIYCQKAGLTIINNWNDGGPWSVSMTEAEINEFASSYSSISAVLDQAALEPIANSNILFAGLTVPYSYIDLDQQLSAAIDNSFMQYEFENKESPVFVSLVHNPWKRIQHGIDMYDELYKIYEDAIKKYGSSVEFVTVEQYVQLMRESIGMSPEK